LIGDDTFAVLYEVGNVAVFVNGYKLSVTDFVATNGTEIVLNTPLVIDSLVFVDGRYDIPVGNTSSSTLSVDTGSFNNLSGASVQDNLASVDAEFSRRISSGSSNPSSPRLGDEVWRTDLDAWYKYNGATWLEI